MSFALPSPRAPKVSACALAVATAMALGACEKPPPPVAPGPPIPAVPDVVVGTMQAECGALLGAFDTYDRCPNVEAAGHAWSAAWRENLKLGFDASEKVHPDEAAQHAMAHACHRATLSVRAATQRCRNGKPPRVD